jgi:hypothetical protein
LRVTERLRRVDFGHLQYQLTFDDPETLTKPLTLSIPVSYRADTDMLENVCNENNRSRLVGVQRAGVPVDSAVLKRYEGQYAFSAGSPIVAGFMGMTTFFLDASGGVTRLVLGQTEGEAVYTPRK